VEASRDQNENRRCCVAEVSGNQVPPARSRRGLKVILVALVLCRGLVLLCVMPPFEGWDEFQHVAYIVHLCETGQRPILGETIVPQSLQSRLSAFPHGHYALKMLQSTGAVDYTSFWNRPDLALARSAKRADSTPLPLYEAQHSPFFYSLAAPIFTLAGGVSDLRMSIGMVRFANLLLTAASVWIALGIADRLIRDRALYGLCSLLIALQPLFLINGVRVANDALGLFLATSAIAVALDRRTFRSRASMFALGLLVGLAALAKSVNLGLIPFVLICAVVAHRPGRVGREVSNRWFPALGATLLLLSGFLVPTFAEFRENLARYGSFTVMQESVQNRRAGRGLTDLARATASVPWVKWTRNLWLRKNIIAGGWSWAGDSQVTQDRHELLLGLALAGWAWTWRHRVRVRVAAIFVERRGPVLCAVLCASYSVALAFHSVQSQLAWGMRATNPWYAASVLPMFLLLVAGGAYVWPIGRLRVVLPLSIALFYLDSECSTVLGSMTSLYTAQAGWSTALARLAFLQPGVLGTPTLCVAVVAVLLMASLAIGAVFRLVASELRPTPTESLVETSQNNIGRNYGKMGRLFTVAKMIAGAPSG
jgi:hypothetical protein